MNPSHFKAPFLSEKLPAWNCSACMDGVLLLDKGSLKYEETLVSIKNREDENWEPDWLRKRFTALLRCSHCDDPVMMVGATEVIEHLNEESCWGLYEMLSPRYILPAPPVVRVPPACPHAVSAAIEEASALFWPSPATSANKIRAALERLMDAHQIPATTTNGNGKTSPITLHRRIELFTASHVADANSLFAIKWLGNDASHTDGITSDEVIDAFALLEGVLVEIYDLEPGKLMQKAAKIVANKGPLSKPKK